jgi:hypothetical protein
LRIHDKKADLSNLDLVKMGLRGGFANRMPRFYVLRQRMNGALVSGFTKAHDTTDSLESHTRHFPAEAVMRRHHSLMSRTRLSTRHIIPGFELATDY